MSINKMYDWKSRGPRLKAVGPLGLLTLLFVPFVCSGHVTHTPIHMTGMHRTHMSKMETNERMGRRRDEETDGQLNSRSRINVEYLICFCCEYHHHPIWYLITK